MVTLLAGFSSFCLFLIFGQLKKQPLFDEILFNSK
jgi:hypothetical protein